MLNAKVEQAINGQINYEFYSAYLYLAMAAWFKQENYNGFSHWMRIQYLEETFHAQKQFDFVHDRDGKVTLQEIAKPPHSWKSPLDAFKQAYEHEQTVTARLGDIDELALKNRDQLTHVLMQWFINEQIEEEANAKDMADQIKMAGTSPDVLFRLDREAAARAVSPLVTAGIGLTAAPAAP